VELTCGAFSLDRDTVARYAELGISRLVIPPPAFDADSLVPALERFAREVIEPCRNL
jgi:hypothetical protein